MPAAKTTDLATTTSGLDPTQTYYFRELLTRAKYKLYYSKWADEKPLPKNSGKNVIFRRYAHLALAQVPLAEGVPPTGKVPTLEDMSATLKQFGDYIAITDLLDATGIDDVQTHWTGLLGDQYGMTIDAVDRDVATATTSKIFRTGTTNVEQLAVVRAEELDLAIRMLQEAGAEHVLGGNAGTTTIGSVPVMPAYAAIVSPRVMYSVQNIAGYRSAQEYRGASMGEQGRYREIAFFPSPDPSTLGGGAKRLDGLGAAGVTATMYGDGTNAHVFVTLIMGKHAFTTVPLSAATSRLYRKPFGSSGVADPLDQVMSIGWKNTSARRITNQSWMVAIYSAAAI